jgi:hypothetical protein
MGKRSFNDLPREEQRQDLIRRLRRLRRECEQQQIDLESFNDMQRARGGETIPRSSIAAATLAWVDQKLAELEK